MFDLKAKFEVYEDLHKKYIMGSLGKKWRDDRSRLYNDLYDPALDWEGNMGKRPSHIPAKQWAGFLTYRMQERTQIVNTYDTLNIKLYI